MSALLRSARALRSAFSVELLQGVSNASTSSSSFAAPSAVTGFWRSYAEVKGSFLDRKQVEERVIETVKKFDKVDPAKVTLGAHFQKDLGLDSLDTVEVVMSLEEEFGCEIPDSDAEKIASCKDAVEFFALQPKAVPTQKA